MAQRAARNVIRSARTDAQDPPVPTAQVVDTCGTALTASVNVLNQDIQRIMPHASRAIRTASTAAAQAQITQLVKAPAIPVRKLSSASKQLLKAV